MKLYDVKMTMYSVTTAYVLIAQYNRLTANTTSHILYQYRVSVCWKYPFQTGSYEYSMNQTCENKKRNKHHATHYLSVCKLSNALYDVLCNL